MGASELVSAVDPRWIVSERDDGKNCNNWHWSETNLTEWSKERLTELLVPRSPELIASLFDAEDRAEMHMIHHKYRRTPEHGQVGTSVP